MYIYDLLYRKETGPNGQHQWFLASNPNAHDPALINALNQLSVNGWDVVGIGDFGYGNPTGLDEILLRKQRG
ncbi:hypothetical protein GPA27_26255 [Aromatoleum toluolicum]|uniref:Uncharacterized protein n=1 Tax=Aromatoleum toluolicum TaxID=90060 RepID=A0ABX1NND9_9RHOO|nr:hypothetical protein [Aromatoleum toluolicum]NMG00888.1 hypothetical protein [Aromatoleum toluolicum]